MKQTAQWISKALFYIVAVGLFTYAGSRSLDFVTATLPPDKQILGWLALLATSGGAVSWLTVYLFSAKGAGQKGLSLGMVAVDLLGEFTLFTFDTLLRSGEVGLVMTLTPEAVRGVVIAMSALIAVNIVATFGFHLLDIETSKRMREDSAKDALDAEVLKAIEEKAPALAQQLAPKLVAEWERDFIARFGTLASVGLKTSGFGKNGSKPEPEPEFMHINPTKGRE